MWKSGCREQRTAKFVGNCPNVHDRNNKMGIWCIQFSIHIFYVSHYIDFYAMWSFFRLPISSLPHEMSAFKCCPIHFVEKLHHFNASRSIYFAWKERQTTRQFILWSPRNDNKNKSLLIMNKFFIGWFEMKKLLRKQQTEERRTSWNWLSFDFISVNRRLFF